MRLVKREGERERENHFCTRANSLFCWIQWLQPQMPRKAWTPANCVRVREAFRGPESTGWLRPARCLSVIDHSRLGSWATLAATQSFTAADPARCQVVEEAELFE
jgi:hypothetical protein